MKLLVQVVSRQKGAKAGVTCKCKGGRGKGERKKREKRRRTSTAGGIVVLYILKTLY